MRFCLKIATALYCVLSVPALAAGDFGLIDHQGKFQQLSRHAESRAVVVLVQSLEAEASLSAATQLEQLRQDYAEEDLVFWILNPVDEPSRIRDAAAAAGSSIPVLLDSAGIVAYSLQAVRAGEVFILNPDSYQLLYRGAVGASMDSAGSRSLQLALEAVVNGSEPLRDQQATDAAHPIAYRYPLDGSADAVSYREEIVPLLRRNCTTCHVEGGLAPWAMDSHIMVLGWSPMIRETVLTARMPPGQIDPGVGRWHPQHYMSLDDQALLIGWIDAGAPRDGEHDPLRDPPPAVVQWELGTPDLIVELPAQQIPATGVVDFKLGSVDLDLQQEKWLSAVAYLPGARTSLHSVMLFALQPGAEGQGDAALVDSRHTRFISLFVPGHDTDRFPEGSGLRLAPDDDLSFKLRYITSGRPALDSSRIGLYFRDTPPERELRSLVASSTQLSIPPNTRDHRVVAETQTVSEDFQINMFSPHAHNRGSRMKLTAIHPDGRQELLINVANYNYNWQMAYQPASPLQLPAGTRLLAETVYDNSVSNPLNPNPDAEVRWALGEQGEMFSHYVRILLPHDAQHAPSGQALSP